MAASPRLIVLSALAAAPLLVLTGCGASATEARQTIVPVQPSSYVVQEPVPTTTTTTAPPTASTPTGGQISTTEQSYQIQGGDSLSKIAGLYDVTIDDIINYNGWTDGINHLLIPGDTIKIPPNAVVPGSGTGTGTGTGTTGSTPSAGSTEVTEPSGEGCSYTIVAGDNPSKVATKYGITVDELRAANPAEVLASFLVGATLVIPPNGDC